MNRTCSIAGAVGIRWIRIVVLVLGTALGLIGQGLHAQSAAAFYKHGVAAEAREDYDAAYTAYQNAYDKAPKELRYRESFHRVRVPASSAHMVKGRKLAATGDVQGALAEFLRAAEIDSGNEAALQEIGRIRAKMGQAQPEGSSELDVQGSRAEIETMSSPVDLKPISNEPLTLHMSEDAKVVYQAVGRAAGVNIIFDPDYSSKRVQVDLNSVNLMDALRIVGTLSNTFWRPVTANTIFVAQNTRAKRTEMDQQAVQTFYLSNAWQQNDLNDVQTALRNVLPNAKVYGVASQNAIVMRGSPDELLLAQKLINDLDKARPEVVVDISILQVSKNWEQNLGMSWPSSASVALQSASTTTTSGTTTTTSTAALTLSDLAHLNSSNFAVTIGAAKANLLLSDSNTKILQNPRIRATDQQKATMKIGSRIPIATGSYQTGAATTSVSSLVNTQFQYIDVGVNIEITPTVHSDRDVTLKVKIEVSSQSGSTTISGVTQPIIAQKTSEQTVRLREGEANILGGILNQQDQATWSGIPGLSSIPILKYLFGSKDHTVTDDQIVFLLVPRVVRAQSIDALNLRSIDTGVGQTIELRHTGNDLPAAAPAVVQPVRPAATPQPAARPTVPPQASVAPLPGQTAQAALPAALAQMRDAALNEPVPIKPVAAAAPAPGTVSFVLGPLTAPVANGATFQVPVVLNGGVNIASAPLQLKYDPAALALVNVTAGDFLAKDGQAVAMVHRDDGAGILTLNSARPPGAGGVSGSGTVCVLSFQAKLPGTSTIEITRPAAIDGDRQMVPAQGSKLSVEVK